MSKTYLIVGGSSGIGLKLTENLSRSGHKVIVASRSSDTLGGMPAVEHITYDVTSDDQLNLSVDQLDGYAYCPGTINLKPFHRLKAEDFQNDFNVNVMGMVKTLQEVLPLLKKGDQPAIVLFSTVAVGQGMSFHTSVSASKGAIEGLTRSLAAELAPTIRVNCIAPSVVNTPLASRILSSEEKIERSAKRHPLSTVGEPSDIADVAEMLLSEQSKWMTGQVLGVDGGLSTIQMM
ncbi:MAG: SDR family oxidoreductase [Bacteroidota bacterium]